MPSPEVPTGRDLQHRHKSHRCRSDSNGIEIFRYVLAVPCMKNFIFFPRASCPQSPGIDRADINAQGGLDRFRPALSGHPFSS